MIENILKEAKRIEAAEDWKEKEVRNPATGNMVKVKSLAKELQVHYKPKTRLAEPMDVDTLKEKLSKAKLNVDIAEHPIYKGRINIGAGHLSDRELDRVLAIVRGHKHIDVRDKI